MQKTATPESESATAETAVTRVYENTSLTFKARLKADSSDAIEEVTFKFLKDGEVHEEKTVPISEGKPEDGQTVVTHVLKAPAVADDQDSYFIDYHYFYTFKNPDESTEALQDFPSSRIQVFPRLAQLKVTDKDGKAFPDFRFTVVQGGEPSDPVKTVATDTPNAKGETIPAGSCEFNLGLLPGFRLLPAPPYEFLEEVVAEGRAREVKGAIGFRAVLLAPKAGQVKQYVDADVEQLGRTGRGQTVTVQVSAHPDDLPHVSGDPNAVVHFRATFGPAAGEAVEKSARDDAKHPTAATGPSDVVTVEEKEAKKSYEGKVQLKDGVGELVLELGKAGGDTCKLEIAGSSSFLSDTSIAADQTLELENWRRVHYELLVPDLMLGDAPGPGELEAAVERQLGAVGRELFVEFAHEETHVFKALEHAEEGTLFPGRFLGGDDAPGRTVYLLTGRTWRGLPTEQAWVNANPTKTVKIVCCDALMKWRKDASDANAGTKDFSGSLTEPTGSVDVPTRFDGSFLPFSGHDGGDGISEIEWTADITSADGVKFTPELEIEEDRPETRVANTLVVELATSSPLPAEAQRIEFSRPSFPRLKIQPVTSAANPDEADDGKLTLKETAFGKELSLTFETIQESDSGDADPDPAEVTEAHQDQLLDFFESLFTDNKDALRAADPSANLFKVEVHGKSGHDGRTARIDAAVWAARGAHAQARAAEAHSYLADDFGDAGAAQVERFVQGLLADKPALAAIDAKVKVRVSCAADYETGEDDCYTAVKDKLQEVFDAQKAEFTLHPGLDAEGEPRTGRLPLADVTNALESSLQEWHFQLPEVLSDGSPGPGAFVGAEKTQQTCPVKISFSVQAHEPSTGEVEGTLLAWPAGDRPDTLQLVRLILRALNAGADDAKLDHPHGADAHPGDCLADAPELCDDCVKHGRSLDLTTL